MRISFNSSVTEVEERIFLSSWGLIIIKYIKLKMEGPNYVRIITASISVVISESFKLAPTLFNPLFNSSNVICPLLSVSSILNISLNPAISSSDKLSAMTYRHYPVNKNVSSDY
jgi:hypothetical protein